MVEYDYDNWDREQLLSHVKILQNLINEADEEIKKYRDNEAEVFKLMAEYRHKLSEAYWAPIKNERGAGRKSKLNDDVIVKIKQYRSDGMSFNDISLLLGLSVGLVHKASKL